MHKKQTFLISVLTLLVMFLGLFTNGPMVYADTSSIEYKQMVTPKVTVGCEPGWCLKYVDNAYAITGSRSYTATEGWEKTQFKHLDKNFPKGCYVPIWFSVNGVPDGHVAILGPDGKVYSSSHPTWTVPYVHDSLDAIIKYYSSKNALTYLGWSEDLEGVRVVKPAVTDGLYALVATSSTGVDFSIDLKDGKKINGARLQIWQSDLNNSNQKFNVKRQADGSFTITPMITPRVVDLAGGKTTDGAVIQVYDSNNTNSQRWLIESCGGDKFTIKSKASGKVLDISGGVFKNGTMIQQFTANNSISQKFKLVPVTEKPSDLANGVYTLKNTTLNQVLNVYTDNAPASGNEVTMFKAVAGDKAQQFTLEKLGTDYLIRSATSNVVLNVYNDNKAVAGDNVNLFKYVSGDICQLWIVEKVGTSQYFIRSKANSNLVLVPMGSFKGITDVKLDTYTGADWQKWEFVK